MRKVLLRIVFDRLWQVESVGNELLVGYASVIALWLAITAIAMTVIWRTTRDRTQVLSSLLFWCIIPAFVAAVPILGLPIAKTGVPIFGYGFMLFVGFSTATWLASRRANTVGLSSDVIWDLMMWLLVPGIIGARIVYLMQYGDKVFAGANGAGIFKAAIALWDGGIVFYGGIIGGVVGLLMFCRKRNIRPLLLADVIMPSLFVGLGFGRLGCFLYGCCFGAACGLPWAVHFPQDSMTFESLSERSARLGTKLLEADGVPVSVRDISDMALDSGPTDAVLTTIGLHPTQVYSSVLAFCLAGLLMWYFRRRPFDGAVVSLGWILYPIIRFVLEVIRDDEKGRMGTTLTFSQLMSIGLFVSGCIVMWWLQRRHAANPVPAEPKAIPGKP